MNRFFYTLLLYLLLPFTPLKLVWRARHQPEYLKYWRERYGIYSFLINKPVIWLHCVSVGETRAASPLIKALLHEYPKHAILLTHTTPTGRETSDKLFGDTVKKVYLPYDVPYAVNRFLKHFKPTIGILMETELWFNIIAGCKKQAIPLLLVNARLSEKSLLGYSKLGRLVQNGLQNLSAVGAQSKEDAERLKTLGAEEVAITGNLKFDVIPPENAQEFGSWLRDQIGGNRPVFLAASTRDGEEEIILDAISYAKIPDLIVIIVPRHLQRVDEIVSLLKKYQLPFLRRTEFNKNELKRNISSNCVIIGDTLGEMFGYYFASDIAFVGGSLLPFGGQNLFEAFAMGKPVLIGPHTFNFSQSTERAIAMGAALRVNNAIELAASLKALMTDVGKKKEMGQAGLKFIKESCGATQLTLKIIQDHIKAL